MDLEGNQKTKQQLERAVLGSWTFAAVEGEVDVVDVPTPGVTIALDCITETGIHITMSAFSSRVASWVTSGNPDWLAVVVLQQ